MSIDHGKLLALCAKARELQATHYGDGCGLHLDMIDWAKEYDSALTQPAEAVEGDGFRRSWEAVAKTLTEVSPGWDTPDGSCDMDRACATIRRLASHDAAQGVVEMSPEFTDSARAALAWVLYHHQGGKSAVGQAIRYALGMGANEHMQDWRIAEAKEFASRVGWQSSDFQVTTPDTTAAELLGLADRVGKLLTPWSDGEMMDERDDIADSLRTLAGKIKESGT